MVLLVLTELFLTRGNNGPPGIGKTMTVEILVESFRILFYIIRYFRILFFLVNPDKLIPDR